MVSTPIRSAVCRGPMGCPKQLRKTSSTVSASATPSWTRKAASFTVSISTRLDTKPHASLTGMAFLPIEVSRSRTFSSASGEVWWPGMSSTAGFIGTGFMKCTPTNWRGRVVSEASRVIGMAEVLATNTASGWTVWSISR